ncbi:MAG: hypothetical protein IPM35_25865 [Myxococcales bacterium]|nr:hypothetical protein [Myxococcales bacterium]
MVRALGLVTAGVSLACNSITGVDDLEKVDCVTNCGSGGAGGGALAPLGVSVGRRASCAIISDKSVRCWGANPGVLPGTVATTPVSVAKLADIDGIVALSKSSSVKEDCVDGRCPPATHDDLDSARRYGTVSTLAFVVAGVGAGVGVYALLASGEKSSPERRASRPQRLEAWVGPGSAGARGSF